MASDNKEPRLYCFQLKESTEIGIEQKQQEENVSHG